MVEGHGGQGDVGVGGLGVSVTITARSGHDVMQGSGHCKLQCMADHLGCKQTTEEWVADLTIISPKLDLSHRAALCPVRGLLSHLAAARL